MTDLRNREPDSVGRPAAPVLGSSPEALTDRYDVALLDLDGVVYLGGHPIPGAAEALDAARGVGMRLAYVTNNASRRPDQISELLVSLGVRATVDDVVTSAQAAARRLRERLGRGAPVLVVGTDALRAEISAVGLRPVSAADDRPEAVVQGYGREVGWPELAEAMVALRQGAWWVATNMDVTLPSVRGPLPGNGALVGALKLATGLTPLAVGKPEIELHAEAVRRTGARRPLVVGDRLDTDIEGAVRARTDSLLVLTGVTDAAQLLGAPAGLRPTYVAAGLTGLLTGHPTVVADAQDGRVESRCGNFRARRAESETVLAAAAADGGAASPADVPRTATESAGADSACSPGDIDALRALCAVTWFAAGPAADVQSADSPRVRAADETAAAALRRLGLR